MSRTSPLSLIALLTLSLAAQAPPQDASAPKVPDKEVAEKLAKLKEVVNDRKTARDDEGRKLIDELVQKLQAGMIDKDKQSLVKGLGDALFSGKLRKPDSTQLYVAAAAALGFCGPDGASVLLKAYEDGNRFDMKPEWVPLRETFLKFLGKTKDERMVKFLCEQARRNPTPALMGAAGEALGNFDEAKEAVRKQIVGELLIRYGELDQRARIIDPNNLEAQNAKDTLAAISDKWNTTLGKLSRQAFRSFPEWNTWFNKNRNSEWK